MCGFCNVMCGFCNVCVGFVMLCVGFVMLCVGFVMYMWVFNVMCGFCNGWARARVWVFVGFAMRGCFGNVYTVL